MPVSLASVLDSTHARHGHLADAGSKPQLKLEESAGDKNMETKSHPKTVCRGPRGGRLTPWEGCGPAHEGGNSHSVYRADTLYTPQQFLVLTWNSK